MENDLDNMHKLEERVQALENTLATLITWQVSGIGTGGVLQLLDMLKLEKTDLDEPDEEPINTGGIGYDPT